jgi:hypothetical protein
VFANEKRETRRFDPRFEERCGDFDEFIFDSNYQFLEGVRKKEKMVSNAHFEAVRSPLADVEESVEEGEEERCDGGGEDQGVHQEDGQLHDPQSPIPAWK